MKGQHILATGSRIKKCIFRAIFPGIMTGLLPDIGNMGKLKNQLSDAVLIYLPKLR